MTETRSVLVRISGRVQGVGFRDWTQREAAARGVSGWVRNLPSGEVEAVFSGPVAIVEDMLAACRNGPRFAHVERVTIAGEADSQTGGFTIRR
jgi:acylphosphatase